MTTVDTSTGLPQFPMDRKCPYQPPEDYDQLIDQGPVAKVALYDGRPAWVITSHELARALLTDSRLSSDWTNPAFPVTTPVRGAIQKNNVMIGMDEPDHGKYRRMVIPSFTVKRMNQLRPGLQKVVDERIDDLIAAGPPADLVGSFAVAVPSMAICQLLGVPYSEHEFFESETRKLVMRTDGATAAAALGNLRSFLDRMITEKQGAPGESLLDDLIRDHLATGAIERDTLVTMCTIMLMAGHETTANAISLGLLTLLEHPEQFAALREDPDLVPGAVEEIMRFLSIAEIFPRVAAADFELAGHRIAKDDAVFLASSAINRDPAVFPEPHKFDVRRATRLHIGFGYGVHQCVGQNLARAELDIVFRALVTRLPDVRLAVPVSEIKAKPGSGPQGVLSLPIIW
jgi:pentalenic acid synthase